MSPLCQEYDHSLLKRHWLGKAQLQDPWIQWFDFEINDRHWGSKGWLDCFYHEWPLFLRAIQSCKHLSPKWYFKCLEASRIHFVVSCKETIKTVFYLHHLLCLFLILCDLLVSNHCCENFFYITQSCELLLCDGKLVAITRENWVLSHWYQQFRRHC